MKNSYLILPLVPTLVTFCAIVIMFALGVWQLQRAEQKTLRLEWASQAKASQSVGLAEVMSSDKSMLDMPVSFEGEAHSQQYFLLDNQIHQHQVGYHVLVPVQTQQGWLLINYGWIKGTGDRDILPDVSLAAGRQVFNGIVAYPSRNVMISETAVLDGVWPKVMQQVDLAIFARHFSNEFLPLVVKLDPTPDSPYVRQWKPVVMPPEKHLAYAVQWFLLAIAAGVIFVVAHKKRLNRN
jgi:cytochrome oxidase assembly protein ShyY1